MKLGSMMWQIKNKLRRNPWRLILPLAVVLGIVLLTSSMLLTDEEVVEEDGTRTVGQAVIDGWVYGGLDSAGNMIFQQGDQVVLLPQGSEEVKLNGKQAQILQSSADTIRITNELPEQEEAETGFFSASFWLVCGVGIGWWLGRQRPTRRTYTGSKPKRWIHRRFVR